MSLSTQQATTCTHRRGCPFAMRTNLDEVSSAVHRDAIDVLCGLRSPARGLDDSLVQVVVLESSLHRTEHLKRWPRLAVLHSEMHVRLQMMSLQVSHSPYIGQHVEARDSARMSWVCRHVSRGKRCYLTMKNPVGAGRRRSIAKSECSSRLPGRVVSRRVQRQ